MDRLTEEPGRCRLMVATFACAISIGCRSYVETTPRTTLEDDNEANYSRVFGEPRPGDVTVVNSVIVAYTMRPGVVTTDDFEFELLVPPGWMDRWGQSRGSSSSGIFALALRGGDPRAFAARQARPIRPWYAPQPIDAYDLHTDFSSVGYLHVLVDRERAGERLHVFVSKH